jgi:hypothetical protein
MVLFAVGAKLALVHRYGTDQPYADQWAAEGMYLLRGPLYYQVDLTQITASHGEHRPGLTRLWVLGLIRANAGQWDCFVELVANLLIYGAFLAVAWRWLATLVDGYGLIVVAGLMALLFGLPCAYENFLWGFQSQFLFLLLLGLLHIFGTYGETRLGIRWWLAQVAGLLGLFSIAAGSMSAATLVLLAGLELWRGRRDAWVWSTLVVNLILFGFGLWLLSEALIPASSRIARLGQAVVGMGHLLSWPLTGFWWSLLLQAPWVVLLATAWRKRGADHTAGDRMVAALGLWVAGMAFAIAYGRVVNSENIGVRYYDVLILGLFVNLPALFRIGSRPGRGWRVLGGGLGFVWLLMVAMGLWAQNKPANLGPLFKFQRDQAIEQREIIRDFLVTSDPAKLQAFENTVHRFPHFQITLDFLRDPKVPPLLPPSLTPDGHAGPLSRLAVQTAAGWPVILGAGAFLLVAGAVRQGSDARKKPPA